MSLLQSCQDALAAVERAYALFGDHPAPVPETGGAGVGLPAALRYVRAAAADMSSQTGVAAQEFQRFIAAEVAGLDRAVITDEALNTRLSASSYLAEAGAARLRAIIDTTRALVESAPAAHSAADQRAILSGLRSQVVQAREVVDSTRQQAAGLADDIRALHYGSGVKDLGQSPPPPPTLPPPRTPPPNDDPWTHGGDRRISSVASAGIKQKLVAVAFIEMDRNGQRTAMRMLQHYLDNSGTPEVLSPELVDAWLSDTTNGYGPLDPALAPASFVRSELDTIAARARDEARRTGEAVTLTGATPWTVVAGSDGDAVRTLGHYSASTAYTIAMNPDGSYVLTYRNDLYDWYNFATTTPMPWDVARNISNAAHDLHAAGYAQDFLITGSGSTQTVHGTVP